MNFQTISTLTLGFMMSLLVITAIANTITHLMTFKQAQRLNSLLNEDGYHTWAVDGFSVNLLLDGVIYNIQIAERQANEK